MRCGQSHKLRDRIFERACQLFRKFGVRMCCIEVLAPEWVVEPVEGVRAWQGLFIDVECDTLGTKAKAPCAFTGGGGSVKIIATASPKVHRYCAGHGMV